MHNYSIIVIIIIIFVLSLNKCFYSWTSNVVIDDKVTNEREE